MRKLYTSANGVWVGHLRALLAEHGIHAMLKNGFLSSGAGELPPIECWPELWVSDADWRAAEQLIGAANEAPLGAPWRCPRCGESVGAEFAACWNCGRAEPD